jgi:ferredoxin-type protein NapH
VFFLIVLFAAPLTQIVRTYNQNPFPYKQSPLYQSESIRESIGENQADFNADYKPVYDNISGGPYSLKFYVFKIAEPFTAALYGVKNVFNGGFWSVTAVVALAIPLLFALLFGRMYCGYICPWSLIVNLNLKIQKKLFNRVPKSSASMLNENSKWRRYYEIILLLLIFTNPWVLQYLLPAALLQQGYSDWILFGSGAFWLIGLLGLLLFEIASPAYYCRNLCPSVLFLSWFGKVRYFSLGYAQHTKCDKGCDLCDEECWLGLNPKTKAQDAACDLCSRCVSVCPTKRLTIVKKKSK